MMPLRVYICPAGEAGMALYSYKLANALVEKGVEVSLFVDYQYELDNLPARFTKIKVLSGRGISDKWGRHKVFRTVNIIFGHLLDWYRFYCHVKRNRPEIVHIQSLFYLVDWLALGFLGSTNSQIVLTVHDVMPHKFYTKYFTWAELVILGRMYKRADKLIVHSEMNRQQLLYAFPVVEDKAVVIPHGEYSLSGVTQEISQTKARSALNLDDNQRVILFFGYIRKIKGLDVLLRAFDRVAEKYRDVVLIIAGSVIQGESFDEYGAFINEMKYGKRVKCFIKYVKHEDIPKFFIAADIVVVPYLQFQSQSGVIHLAQGFGKAVIASDVGGLPEVIEDKETGLIVPSGDVERLADAMSYLLESGRVRLNMGRRAREVSMEKFSWDAIAEATIEKAYSQQSNY
jgi:glycosyltransferase involved in cell wall biosynthesis